MALTLPTGDASSQLALDAKALGNLKLQAKAAPEQALKSAASQFEALFMQMLLKSMREALPQDGPLSSEATKAYTGMFDQQIAQQLGKKGIGIADLLVKQLSRVMPGATGDAAATTLTKPTSFPLPAPGAVRKSTLSAPAAALTMPAAKATSTVAATPAAAAAATTSGTGTGILGTVGTFIEKLKPYAEAAGRAAGLPGAFLLAQAGLETGWGRFQPKGTDGADSHNLFGIKAGKSWTGPVVEAATTEYVNGKPVTTMEKFRAYPSYTEALQDYAKLVGGNPRYAGAVASAADPAAFAQGLQKAGYATDPNYADKLTAAIRMVARHTAAAPAPPAQVAAGNADIRA